MPSYNQNRGQETRWREYLDSLPWTRGSLDDSANRAFLRAASFKIDLQTATDEIAKRIIDCGSSVRRGKLAHQCADAYRYGGREATITASYPKPKWPAVDSDAIERIVATGPGLYDLWECSPIRWDDSQPHTEEIVDALFPGNPLLCCAFSQWNFATRPREEWRSKLDRRQFIVPSPMTAIQGRTASGEFSAHSLESTGPRFYQVVEFDFKSDSPLVFEWDKPGISIGDACAALLLHLAGFASLICVNSSGGKSLHGWFRVKDCTEQEQRVFFSEAVSLGADPQLWSRSQFCRIPDGLRDNGRRQSCFYFSPTI
jgi:hypothetical protein